MRDFVRLSVSPDRRPRLLVCWPSARMNKFQALLYARAAEHGYAVARISDLAQLDDVSWPGDVVLHAHWFAKLLSDAPDEAAADAAVDAAFERLEAFRGRTGAKLLWTAHNILPHDTRLPDAALRLRRRTVEAFDAVHLLDDGHAELLRAAYGRSLPAKTFTAPHMLYDGVFPDYVGREGARETLEIGPERFVFLFFGSLQPYKGLDSLIRVFRRTAPEHADLVIAGMPSDPATVEALKEAAAADRRVRIDARMIPDDEVQIFMRAADLVVLPYVDGLNSGAALLARTFGVPVAGPDVPAFRTLKTLGVTVFPRTKLGDFLARTARSGVADAPLDPAVAAERSPRVVSDRFFAGVNALFEAAAAPAADEAPVRRRTGA